MQSSTATEHRARILTGLPALTTILDAMNNEEKAGIYFLHPQPVIQDDIIRALVGRDYEALCVRNPTSAKLLIKKSPRSFLFAHIDSGLRKEEWIEYLRDLKSDQKLSELSVCVLSNRTADTIESEILCKHEFITHCISYLDFDIETVLASVEEILNNGTATPFERKKIV